MSKGEVQKGYHCAWQLHYQLVFPVKYSKALLDEMVIKIIEETAEGTQQRYAIEMEAMGMDKDLIHLPCSAHPKIPPGEIVRIFIRRYPRSKRIYGVENSGLMDIMLPLLAREEAGSKWKSISKGKANQRKI